MPRVPPPNLLLVRGRDQNGGTIRIPSESHTDNNIVTCNCDIGIDKPSLQRSRRPPPNLPLVRGRDRVDLPLVRGRDYQRYPIAGTGHQGSSPCMVLTKPPRRSIPTSTT